MRIASSDGCIKTQALALSQGCIRIIESAWEIFAWPAMASFHILELLEQAASHPAKSGINFYTREELARPPTRLTYTELLHLAQQNALKIKRIPSSPDTKILLHFDNHLDNVEYFWSTVAAGYVPAISTPFTNDHEQRKRHLNHLQNLLQNPVIITRQRLLPEFASLEDVLNIWTVEEIQADTACAYNSSCKMLPEYSDEPTAVLMLTSGSTGNAKAVCLRHDRIIEAVKGKAAFHDTRSSDVFLNWVRLDHVANLTEIHLHAMSLAAEQVQVTDVDIIAEPLAFVQLLHKHRVSYTFAPNFFLAALRKAMEKPESLRILQEIDLCNLRALISGGEANVTETCVRVTRLLEAYGAPSNFIRPGFGMTETCAGSIYNKKCPTYDIASNNEFASLGTSVSGLELRVIKDDNVAAVTDEVGNLQVKGSVVFKEYYNNAAATAKAFTSDGWFVTGDRAYIDIAGYLHLFGRATETIIINGEKHFPHELEMAIEEAAITGIMPSYTAVFPHRPQGSPTEAICVVYLPAYNENDTASRIAVRRAISEVTVRQTGARPHCMIPLSEEALPKTTLGKLSRAKLRTAYENGTFSEFKAIDDEAIRSWRKKSGSQPTTNTEKNLSEVYSRVFEISKNDIAADTSIFDMGVSSMELLRLKSEVEKSLSLSKPIAITTIMTNPTIRDLAVILEQKVTVEYDAAVILRSSGKGTPLWLVHPGVGEILIFLHLVKYITDRPIYALRSRGFDGEPFFTSMQECLDNYHTTIKRLQPKGPYAIAGYSYGGTLAFELSKNFENLGDEVGFLGILDQPPNINMRMRHSDWTGVALTLARFLDIVDEAYITKQAAGMRELSHDEVLDRILSSTTPAHLTAMAIDKAKLANWTALALNNHAIARDYEPRGKVKNMEVFYAAHPDTFYANSGDEMLKKHIGKWRDFVHTEAKFHQVAGTHNDMIRPVHVASFYKTFKAALMARNL